MTKELKKVNYDDYKRELERVREELRQEIGGLDVQIQEISYTSKVVELGVNWSSIGASKIDETAKFIVEMQKAMELVKNFKYNGCEIEF
ncbi:hypothetical protein [uncultured Fenollaria sp.]|uniref:hypothetical protein n=1 Tax=uncultured Fenollaria sp. TaxID=1686315 RepID=UPI0025CC2769|nr:hypothetical protein [uncultured Fenollaria sp.]